MREDGKIIENTLDKFPSFSYSLNIVKICAPIYRGLLFQKYFCQNQDTQDFRIYRMWVSSIMINYDS